MAAAARSAVDRALRAAAQAAQADGRPLCQPRHDPAGDGPGAGLAPPRAARPALDRHHRADPRRRPAGGGDDAGLLARHHHPGHGRLRLDAGRRRAAVAHRGRPDRRQAVHRRPAGRRAGRHRRLRGGRLPGAGADHRPRGAVPGDRPLPDAARHGGGRRRADLAGHHLPGGEFRGAAKRFRAGCADRPEAAEPVAGRPARRRGQAAARRGGAGLLPERRGHPAHRRRHHHRPRSGAGRPDRRRLRRQGVHRRLRFAERRRGGRRRQRLAHPARPRDAEDHRHHHQRPVLRGEILRRPEAGLSVAVGQADQREEADRDLVHLRRHRRPVRHIGRVPVDAVVRAGGVKLYWGGHLA
ncbi:putative Peptide chain release factor 2 [uncultured Pleomorphomonas sp.]|uniref:Putative Peptide chain release factor 2 n=1 Tax=uncultured Pleomorphomonas sp. TaxID=442121 RepID=A0A212LPN7_9HYPH|nr:putative Peptide chain release factor 2 [uncultured Pleomorphomonas sp.]